VGSGSKFSGGVVCARGGSGEKRQRSGGSDLPISERATSLERLMDVTGEREAPLAWKDFISAAAKTHGGK